MSSYRTPTVVAAAAIGTLVTGFVAYAAYFDHKRRTDPEFRKALKRESRREARVAREQAEAHGAQQKNALREAVKGAKESGFPIDVEDREHFFMEQVAEGEKLCQDGSDQIEAALCFYKALKVYPQPSDLVTIYDKTVPKPVLDLLAEMIAFDEGLNIGRSGSSHSGSRSGSQHGIDE